MFQAKSASTAEGLTKIRQEMDCANVGTRRNNLSMHLAAPFTATRDEIVRLNQHAGTIESLLSTTARVYRESITNPALHWLRDLFEAELPESVKQVSRQCVEFHSLRQPNVIRPDFINFEQIAEVAYQVNGLGLCHSLGNVCNGREAHHPSRLAQRFAEAIKTYTKKDSPLVCFFSPPGTPATEAFAKVLRACGVESRLHSGEPLDEYDLVFWRSLRNLVRDNDDDFIVRRGLQTLVPTPTCLLGSKIYLALPFDNRTRHYYCDKVRRLIPETSLATEQTMNDLLAMSIRQRSNFIVKYAGQDGTQNWGSRNVFKLGNARSKDSALLKRACEDPHHSPWLVQARIRTKYEATCIDSDDSRLELQSGLSARITPRYVQMPSGSLQLAAGDVMFSKNWKCHGNVENWVTSIVNLNPSN